MPKAAEVKIDPGPIVVLSPDVSLSKTKSEPNKQLMFPVEPCEPIRVADGKKKEVLYAIIVILFLDTFIFLHKADNDKYFADFQAACYNFK